MKWKGPKTLQGFIISFIYKWACVCRSSVLNSTKQTSYLLITESFNWSIIFFIVSIYMYLEDDGSLSNNVCVQMLCLIYVKHISFHWYGEHSHLKWLFISACFLYIWHTTPFLFWCTTYLFDEWILPIPLSLTSSLQWTANHTVVLEALLSYNCCHNVSSHSGCNSIV